MRLHYGECFQPKPNLSDPFTGFLPAVSLLASDKLAMQQLCSSSKHPNPLPSSIENNTYCAKIFNFKISKWTLNFHVKYPLNSSNDGITKLTSIPVPPVRCPSVILFSPICVTMDDSVFVLWCYLSFKTKVGVGLSVTGERENKITKVKNSKSSLPFVLSFVQAEWPRFVLKHLSKFCCLVGRLGSNPTK